MLKNKILLSLVIILSFFNIPSVFARRDAAYHKACFSNQRVILGAIEMYNMDHDVMMTECNEYNLHLLCDEGYLKQMPTKPREQCEYLSNSDLTATGVIYCKYHGSFDHDEKTQQPVVPPSPEYLAEQDRIRYNRLMNELTPVFVVLGVIFVIGFAIIPTKKKKAS